jgi:hypothetical protein
MLKPEEGAIASIAPSSERTPSFIPALRKKQRLEMLFGQQGAYLLQLQQAWNSAYWHKNRSGKI